MIYDKLNWKRMLFRTNKVWVNTDPNDNPIVKNGKVLIKYQLNQDYEYQVNLNGLQEIGAVVDKKSESITKALKKTVSKQKKDHTLVNLENYKDSVLVFTDGASSGNPGPSGIGIYMEYKGHKKEISRFIGNSTNNIAELLAIRIALEELKKHSLPVKILTDSSYAYGLLALGWKPKKNIDLVKSIKQVMHRFQDLEFIKVKGHSGLYGNERADYLATSAIKS